MDSASASALAALAGSMIGGLTSLAATWLSQNAQARTQRLVEYRMHRQQLYQAFIEEASRLYADALSTDKAEIRDLVALYAMISRMRVLSTTDVVKHAEILVDTIIQAYSQPNKSFGDLREIINSNQIDPFREFSDVCRDDLRNARLS